MEPWIIDDPMVPGAKMIDSKIYYQHHRTARYPEEGIDFVRAHVVDYGKDPKTVGKYMQADFDWYAEHHKEIYKKYGAHRWYAINNQHLICMAPYIDDFQYELEDILPQNSYLLVYCEQESLHPLKVYTPYDIHINIKR